MEFPGTMNTPNSLAGYNVQPGIAGQQAAQPNMEFPGGYPVSAPNNLWNYQGQSGAAYNNPTAAYPQASSVVPGYPQENIHGPFSAVNYRK